MENASKALLIAGGVLIAIILISLLVRTYGNIGTFQRQRMTEEEIEKIEEYNKEYTKYLGQYVYGTEVITAINSALNNKEYEIKVYIEFRTEPYTYKAVEWKNGRKTEREITIGKHEILTIDNSEEGKGKFSGTEFLDVITNKNAIDDLKGRYFQCTKSNKGDAIEYDSNTGRVNGIRFIEKARTNN